MGKSKLILTPADEGMQLTREEYADADAKRPWRYERAKGRLIVMSPAGYEHQAAAEPFRNHLGAYKLSHPGVIEHIFQESWTKIDEETDRLPDIAVYFTGGQGRIPDRIPDLIFEIVSQSESDRDRDYREKRNEYESIGVTEYVIVDRFEHRLTVFRLVDSKFSESTLTPNDSYTTDLLPDFNIPLQDII